MKTQDPSPQSASASLSPAKVRMIALLTGAITFAVFLPSLGSDFVNWDDQENFLHNQDYRGLSADNLEWMFTRFHLGHYQPLSWITLAVDYVIWKMNPLGYHLTNILLHAFSAGGCFLLLIAVLGSGRRNGFDDRGTVLLAMFAALFWSLHPLRVEAVAWITQRREVLCGLLTLLAMLSHVRGRSRWLTAALAVAAMFAKVTAVTIPVILIIIDVWQASRSKFPSLREITRIAARHAPLILLAAIMTGVAVAAQREAGAMASVKLLPISSRIALYFFGMTFGVAKTLWPSSLAPLYQWQSTSSWDFQPLVWWTAAAGFVLVVCAAALGWNRRRSSAAFACLLAAFLVLAAPAGGFTQSGPQTTADRYTYQPGWVLSLAVALALAWVTRRWVSGWREGIGCLLLLACAGLTIRQQSFWRNTESLWTREAAVFPGNPMGNYNLGIHYFRNQPNDPVRAEKHFRTAIEGNPDYLEARCGLGFLLRSLGRTREALDVLEGVVRASPERLPTEALGLSATLQWELGQKEQAIVTLKQLLERDPRNPEAFRQLARAQAAIGRPREAVATFERGIAATSGAAILLGDLAWVLSTNPDSSIRDGKRALELARSAAPKGETNMRTVNIMAAACLEAGEFEAGRKAVEAALGQLPADKEPALRRLLGYLERREPIRDEPRFP
jgi:protein O-mannosyl-transferase